MEQKRVETFLLTNQKYLPQEKLIFLKEQLMKVDEERFSMLSTIELKDPTTMLLMSLFLGTFGVDRFMLEDTGMGVLKLLTGGCCGILTLIDIFSAEKRAKETNLKNIMTCLNVSAF